MKFRVQTPHLAVARMLATLAEEKGFKFEATDTVNFPEKPLYFRINKGALGKYFNVHSIQHYQPTKNNDFVSIDEAIQLLINYEKPVLIGNYEVNVNRGYLKIGCQTIPNSVVREILNKLS